MGSSNINNQKGFKLKISEVGERIKYQIGFGITFLICFIAYSYHQIYFLPTLALLFISSFLLGLTLFEFFGSFGILTNVFVEENGIRLKGNFIIEKEDMKDKNNMKRIFFSYKNIFIKFSEIKKIIPNNTYSPDIFYWEGKWDFIQIETTNGEKFTLQYEAYWVKNKLIYTLKEIFSDEWDKIFYSGNKILESKDKILNYLYQKIPRKCHLKLFEPIFRYKYYYLAYIGIPRNEIIEYIKRRSYIESLPVSENKYRSPFIPLSSYIILIFLLIWIIFYIAGIEFFPVSPILVIILALIVYISYMIVDEKTKTVKYIANQLVWDAIDDEVGTGKKIIPDSFEINNVKFRKYLDEERNYINRKVVFKSTEKVKDKKARIIITCPKCNREIKLPSKSIKKIICACGNHIQIKDGQVIIATNNFKTSEEEKQSICGACEAIISIDDNKCPNCGVEFKNMKQKVKIESTRLVITCPNCNRDIKLPSKSIEKIICVCGKRIRIKDDGEIRVIRNFKTLDEGKQAECGDCGAIIPSNISKCPECGVEFDNGEEVIKGGKKLIITCPRCERSIEIHASSIRKIHCFCGRYILLDNQGNIKKSYNKIFGVI